MKRGRTKVERLAEKERIESFARQFREFAGDVPINELVSLINSGKITPDLLAMAAERIEERELKKPTEARQRLHAEAEVPLMEPARGVNYDGDLFQCICGNTAAVRQFWDGIASQFVCLNCGRAWKLTQTSGPWRANQSALHRVAHVLKAAQRKPNPHPGPLPSDGRGGSTNVAGAKGSKKHKNKG